MNCKCRRRCTGTVYVEQRDLSRRTRKHTRSALAAFCHNQARFRELGERLSNESGIGVHTLGQSRGGNFLAVEVTQGSMMCAATANWTLFTDKTSPAHY